MVNGAAWVSHQRGGHQPCGSATGGWVRARHRRGRGRVYEIDAINSAGKLQEEAFWAAKGSL